MDQSKWRPSLPWATAFEVNANVAASTIEGPGRMDSRGCPRAVGF